MSSGEVGSSTNLSMLPVSYLHHRTGQFIFGFFFLPCLPEIEMCEVLHVLDCLVDIPQLIDVDHENCILARDFSH